MVPSDTNIVLLRGVLTADPRLSHTTGDRSFYTVALSVPRLSGVCDLPNLLLPEKLCGGLSEGMQVDVVGSMRSCNRFIDGANRLILSVFADSIVPTPDADADIPQNSIDLTGRICKPPVYRRTPLGRELADIMLAVRRKYGRVDFLPLIAWGKNAVTAAGLATGTSIMCRGRVQSREYIKKTDDGEVKKTAYEVSLSFLEKIE